MLKCWKCGFTIDEKDVKVEVGIKMMTAKVEDRPKLTVRMKEKPEFLLICLKDGEVMKPSLIKLS